jgi:hypothetical protein
VVLELRLMELGNSTSMRQELNNGLVVINSIFTSSTEFTTAVSTNALDPVNTLAVVTWAVVDPESTV